jgi:hypothetical protein
VDVNAAISFVTAVGKGIPKCLDLLATELAFGFREARIKALAALLPPFPMFEFEFSKGYLKPKLLISGSRDDFAPHQPLL